MDLFFKTSRLPKFALLFLAVLILAGRSLQMNQPNILIDDAFISFRYAENLAHGQGLVFNPGERVEGYTNFLWTVLMAGCSKLGLDLITCSKVLSALAAVGILFLIFEMGRQIFAHYRGEAWLVALPLVLFATMGSQARYILSGMETLLFTFLLALAIYLYFFGRRPLLTGLAFALCAMTRPEGVMYFALASIYAVLMNTRLADRYLPPDPKSTPLFPCPRGLRAVFWLAAGFFAVYGIYFLWRYSYYGFLLPNTFYAKAAGFQWSRLGRGWDYLRQLLAWWGLLPILVLSLFSLPSLRRNRVWALFFILVAVTFLYFVYVGGDFIVWFGPRFLMPVLPFLLLMSAEGMANLTGLRPIPTRFKTLAQLALFALLLVNTYGFSWPARVVDFRHFTAQMKGWTEMGRWIAANTPPGTTIATDAAGLIPFYSGRYSLDMFGLSDVHIAHLDLSQAGIVAHEKFDPAYILSRAPDCIVSTWMDAQGHAAAAGLNNVRDQFEDKYQLVAVSKTQYGPPSDGRWLIVTPTFKTRLYLSGYVTGLYCRK